MVVEDFMCQMVYDYISGEIQFINDEIALCEKDNRIEEIKQLQTDLKMLENLSLEDVTKIADKSFDDELKAKIYENIHYYIYH